MAQNCLYRHFNMVMHNNDGLLLMATFLCLQGEGHVAVCPETSLWGGRISHASCHCLHAGREHCTWSDVEKGLPCCQSLCLSVALSLSLRKYE